MTCIYSFHPCDNNGPNLWLLQGRSVFQTLCRHVVVDAMRRGAEELLCFHHVLHAGVEELELGPIHRPGHGIGVDEKVTFMP